DCVSNVGVHERDSTELIDPLVGLARPVGAPISCNKNGTLTHRKTVVGISEGDGGERNKIADPPASPSDPAIGRAQQGGETNDNGEIGVYHEDTRQRLEGPAGLAGPRDAAIIPTT